MKIDGSGQRKTQRCMCSRAHGKRVGRRIQVIAWRRGLLTGLRHGHPAHRYLSANPAWRRGSSDRSSARRPYPQVPQGHPHVPNNPAISLKPASNRTSTGLRHGDLTHRYSRAIPAWQRGSSDRSLARRPRLQVPQGHPRVAKSVFLPVFDTATLPTGTPEPSSRGEDGLLSPLVHEMSLYHGRRGPDRVFVHEMSLSHGHRAPDRVFVHEMSLYHGRRGPDRVFVHEMSLSHGCRGPDRVLVHEMNLYHGRRGPERVLGQIMAFFG